MKSMDKGNIWIILTILSAIFSFLIITLHYFPYLGLAISLASLSTIIYLLKKQKSSFDRWLFTLILILSFCVFYSASPFITLLNILGIIFLGSLLTQPHSDEKIIDFACFMSSPLVTLSQAARVKNEYVFDIKSLQNDSVQLKKIGTGEISKSILLTVFILIIIIPLLASANPFFNKLVIDAIDLFNLEKLIELLLSANYFVWILRIVFFIFLTLLIPRMASYANTIHILKPNKKSFFDNFHLLFPKIAVSTVIFVFFITQTQLYFAKAETLQSLGYTNSQYAREVFAQLTIVAMIIMGLIYNDKKSTTTSKTFTYILIIQGIFLSLIALKSVFDYSSNWGFTHKRLWGYTGVFWIVTVLCFFAYKYYKEIKNTVFVKFVILFSAIVLITINIVNFDYIIYHYAKSTTHSGTDYHYLSLLSSDSQSYRLQLEILESQIKNQKEITNAQNIYNLNIARQNVLKQIQKLQTKYSSLDLRSFNINEYLEYQQIKSIDINHYSSGWILPPNN